MLLLLLVRPETIVLGADLYFAADVFFYFLPWYLRAPFANRREILHRGLY